MPVTASRRPPKVPVTPLSPPAMVRAVATALDVPTPRFEEAKKGERLFGRRAIATNPRHNLRVTIGEEGLATVAVFVDRQDLLVISWRYDRTNLHSLDIHGGYAKHWHRLDELYLDRLRHLVGAVWPAEHANHLVDRLRRLKAEELRANPRPVAPPVFPRVVQGITLQATPYRELAYGKQAPGLWRNFDISDGIEPLRVVGPQYTTKQELLDDFERYVRESWGTLTPREEA